MRLSGIRPSVCPSVPLSHPPPHAAIAGLLLWPGGQEVLIDCCTGSGPFAQQQWRHSTEHSRKCG